MGDLMAAGVSRPNYATVEELKEFRVQVDALIIKARGLEIDTHTNKGDYQLANEAKQQVRIHLKNTKMWLGVCLEAMNNPFPKELADKSE